MFWLCVLLAAVCLFAILRIKFGGNKAQLPAVVRPRRLPRPVIKVLNRDGAVHNDDYDN